MQSYERRKSKLGNLFGFFRVFLSVLVFLVILWWCFWFFFFFGGGAFIQVKIMVMGSHSSFCSHYNISGTELKFNWVTHLLFICITNINTIKSFAPTGSVESSMLSLPQGVIIYALPQVREVAVVLDFYISMGFVEVVSQLNIYLPFLNGFW